MKNRETMSAAVKAVIDSYPAGHRFYGNQLKDDVVNIHPESEFQYVDTILRMARRHRRHTFRVVDRNNSLYEKTAVKPILQEMKELRERAGSRARMKHQAKSNTAGNQMTLFN